MEKSFSIRKIDNLGRIVIPMDIRKALEIHDWDELRICREEDRILIAKAHNTCTFCGSEDDLSPFKTKFVCKNCLSALKKG